MKVFKRLSPPDFNRQLIPYMCTPIGKRSFSNIKLPVRGIKPPEVADLVLYVWRSLVLTNISFIWVHICAKPFSILYIREAVSHWMSYHTLSQSRSFNSLAWSVFSYFTLAITLAALFWRVWRVSSDDVLHTPQVVLQLGASHLPLIAASFERYVPGSLATYARC